ncbi:MAG: hypothetical protein A2035_02170 [Nitrospirae bacterium GWA2_42_11]|nr:MAG: hypothetical protein A2035_02170 [Nitrospirae bacterium GWA2_42_11]
MRLNNIDNFVKSRVPSGRAALRFIIIFSAFLILRTFLAPALVLAEDSLSLKKLIEEARSNNLEIKSLRQNIKTKEARARAEGVLDDPLLRIEMMDISKENPVPTPGNAMQTKYEISQMFPFPGKLSLQKKAALTEILMAEAELMAKELEIIKMVKEMYYDYIYITESIKIIKEIKDLLGNMIRIAEIRYATGQGSQQDIIKAQVEVTMLINETINLNAEREVIKAELQALLNQPQDIYLSEPTGISKDRVEIRPDELIRKTIEINPDIQMTRYGIRIKETEAELSKKNYYPDFMLGVAPIQRDGRFDAWDAMFQINIPLWRGKYDNQVAEISNELDTLKFRLKSEENIKTARVKEWVIKVETADKIRTLYETSLIPQAELSLDSTLKNYQSGNVDFLTLLDTERVLKKTKIEYLDSLITYYKRVASLEEVVGEEIMK